MESQRNIRIGTDLDSTLTNEQKIDEVYSKVYLPVLARNLLLPKSDAEELLQEARKNILANPAMYGWEHNGFIVAPASVDTFVLHTVATRHIIETLKKRKEFIAKLPDDPNPENVLAQQCYFQAYAEFSAQAERGSGTFFRDEAPRFIQTLTEIGTLIIITNSPEAHAQAKVQRFLDAHNLPPIQVVGDAKKYLIDPTWTHDDEGNPIPESMKIPGLSRRIFTRRKHAARVFRAALGNGPSAIIGDSVELDIFSQFHILHFPLGAHLAHSFAAPWEVAYAQITPGLFTANNLDDITQWLVTEAGK